MRELKATDKITQKMTRDGAVSENLATGEVEHISSREPETELSASSEESAGAAADLALRAAEHHEKKTARKAEKADAQAVRDGSAARQRPSSRLQFTEEERADPALGKYIDRSDRAADRLDAAKAAIAAILTARSKSCHANSTSRSSRSSRRCLPCRCSTRLGWDANSKIIVDLAEQLQDCGIAALTIHGRTPKVQMNMWYACMKPQASRRRKPRLSLPTTLWLL